MTPSLLNAERPPVFCPGCAHERVVKALDKAFQRMGLKGEEIVVVSDIGCSGLFDTFFHTHALHGLHGRALTYATGIKMARPDLHVVVTMGDGGLGIGGAHLLSTCRRNIDLTLLVLNNFNYGMTGGQCSSTTPPEAQVGSGFLNRLEKPMDVCQVAGAAGAPYLDRVSAYDPDLVSALTAGIQFEGFALLDIWGVCPGRYTRRNKLSPKSIAASLASLPPVAHFREANAREEYGRHYRELIVNRKPAAEPLKIDALYAPPQSGRREVVILGSAGQRVITAGEILCLSGLTAGLNTTQKNEYNITVLRGHSIAELILSPRAIDYTGIKQPDVVLALAQEGVDRRKDMFAQLDIDALILQADGVQVPGCKARIHSMDLKSRKIRKPDWALASLGVMAGFNEIVSVEMLAAALKIRFKDKILDTALELIRQLRE